jgi:hypothetical protein
VPFNNHDKPQISHLNDEIWGITHEVVEAVTDPTFKGWRFYDIKGNENEICDVAEYMPKGWGVSFTTPHGTYTVSPYWLAPGI